MPKNIISIERYQSLFDALAELLEMDSIDAEDLSDDEMYEEYDRYMDMIYSYGYESEALDIIKNCLFL